MTDIVEQLRDGAESDWAKCTRLDIWAAFTRFVDFGHKREWNAAEVLIEAADEIERLRGLLNDAASAFKRYAFHDIDCNYKVGSAPCDCGYHEVSSQLADRIDAALGVDRASDSP